MKAWYHPLQERHLPRTYLTRGQLREPQEVPARLARILEGLESAGIAVEEPADYGMKPIAAVHELGYLRFLESAHRRWPADWGQEVLSNIYVRKPNPRRGILAEAGYYLADGSCPVGEHTWTSAYHAAQTAVAAAQAVADGEQAAYALCRPPGHHARRDAAGGFCYLNNAAIAAEALRSHFPRVAILDPDMHHGQGIQEIFYKRDDVLYLSIHADPTNFYPVVSGFEDERGRGAGAGYNINLPMPHGSPESTFFERLDEAMDAIRLFGADVLIVTLGFDIYREDPQSQVAMTSEGFHRFGQIINDQSCPVLVVQEGGYHLDSLAENTRQFFTGLGR